MPEPSPTGPADPALAGLGRFAWKVGLGTLLAIAMALGGLKLLPPGPRQGELPAPEQAPPPHESPPRSTPPRAASWSAPGEGEGAATVTLGEVARDVERRHAGGELSEAQRRFEPCPGGDRRRLAWLDAEGKVWKLTRHTAGGDAVEEWFDGAGRLREAVVSRRGAGARHVVIDEGGGERVVGPDGAAPAAGEPWPRLVRSEPGRAFFSGPGCDGGR